MNFGQKSISLCFSLFLITSCNFQKFSSQNFESSQQKTPAPTQTASNTIVDPNITSPLANADVIIFIALPSNNPSINSLNLVAGISISSIFGDLVSSLLGLKKYIFRLKKNNFKSSTIAVDTGSVHQDPGSVTVNPMNARACT